MLPGKVYKPEDFLHIIRKRAWLIAVPWACVAAVTAGVGRLLPDRYRTQAIVQYSPPSVPDSIMRPPTTSALAERLRSIEQIILSRTRLERLIQEFNLYQEERKTRVMEDVATMMRADIKTTPVKGDTFSVQYVGSNPVTVMKVTERLASYFIEESLREGQRRAEGTSSYLEAEVDEKHRQLLDIEDRLTKYKMQHAGELPEQAGANLQTVQGLQNQIQALGLQMNNDASRRLTMERDLKELEDQAGPAAPPPPSGAQDPATMSGTAQQRLNAAQQQLDVYKASGMRPTHYKYGDLERLIRQLQKAVNDEALRAPVSSNAGLPPAELARQQKLRSYRDELDLIAARTAQNEADIKRLRQKAGEYQSKADLGPIRGAELTELTREYQTIKNIHEALVAQREAAARSVNLQRRQIGEQFTLLDAARVPQAPFSPDRAVINIGGIAGGLALGLLLAAFLEYRDSTFKNDSELASLLSMPVLAVVPLMQSDAERRSQFRRRMVLNVGLGGVVAVCVAVLGYSFVFMR